MPRGEVISGELVARFDDGGIVSELYRIRIQAGTQGHQATYAPGVRKVMTVFAGELIAALPDGTRVVGAGHSAEWIADRPHTYAAGSAEDVQAAVLMRYPIARPGRRATSPTSTRSRPSRTEIAGVTPPSVRRR
ncbi:MAG TPA: hypothetical protein VH834_21735 [Solirubrobacteraceae bacterium]|jgi:hypothetical protein